jgi:nucleolar protein 9
LSPLLLEAATQGFIDFDETKLNNVARHSIFSHGLEKCLEPSVSVARRRQLGHKLTALCSELAVNAYGSHVVDALWRYTYRIKFLREQVATSLTKNETTIKNSPYGKIVWKNWQLEKYVRRRHEWWAAVKALEDEISSQLGTSHDAIAAKQQRKPAPESTSIQQATTGGPGKFKRRPKTAAKPYDKPHRPAKAAAN